MQDFTRVQLQRVFDLCRCYKSNYPNISDEDIINKIYERATECQDTRYTNVIDKAYYMEYGEHITSNKLSISNNYRIAWSQLHAPSAYKLNSEYLLNDMKPLYEKHLQEFNNYPKFACFNYLLQYFIAVHYDKCFVADNDCSIIYFIAEDFDESIKTILGYFNEVNTIEQGSRVDAVYQSATKEIVVTFYRDVNDNINEVIFRLQQGTLKGIAKIFKQDIVAKELEINEYKVIDDSMKQLHTKQSATYHSEDQIRMYASLLPLITKRRLQGAFTMVEKAHLFSIIKQVDGVEYYEQFDAVNESSLRSSILMNLTEIDHGYYDDTAVTLEADRLARVCPKFAVPDAAPNNTNMRAQEVNYLLTDDRLWNKIGKVNTLSSYAKFLKLKEYHGDDVLQFIADSNTSDAPEQYMLCDNISRAYYNTFGDN